MHVEGIKQQIHTLKGRKSDAGKVEGMVELERLNKELNGALAQLRHSDEEIERVWFDKVALEKELRGLLDARDQALSETQRMNNELTVLMKTKDEWILELEMQLKVVSSKPDDSVLERELKNVRGELAELGVNFEGEKLQRTRAEDKVTSLERSLTLANSENDRLENELKATAMKLAGLNQMKKDLEESESNKITLEGKVESLSKERTEISKQVSLLTEQLNQMSMRLRSHFAANGPPDFEAKRIAKESAATLEVQRQETARYSAEVSRLTEQLREIKCSTVDFLTAENERLKRRSVEASRLLAEEQAKSAEIKVKAGLYSEMETEKLKMLDEFEKAKNDWNKQQNELSTKIEILLKENSEQKVKIDKLDQIQNLMAKADVLSGLQALQSLSQTISSK